MHFTDYDTRLAAYAVIVEHDRILLTWWNGQGRGEPAWTLPGGGVEYEETVEQAVMREVREEAGFRVEVGEPLVVHTRTGAAADRGSGRPFKAVQVVFGATIVGGEFGTVEVDGSTDFAAWVPLAEVAGQASRTDIIDIGVTAWRARHQEISR